MKQYEKHAEVICPVCGKLGRSHLEKTSCGKKNCKKCEGTRKVHGPYWYIHHYEKNRRVKHHYVGKVFPEEPSDTAIKYLIEPGQVKTKEEATELYQTSLKQGMIK